MSKKIVTEYCAICDKEHELELCFETTITEIKGEKIEYKADFFRCPINTLRFEDNYEEGNTWCNGEMLDNNLLRGRNAYRIKHNLLTSDEIIAIRKKYGFTQKELSNILGWGNVTITRYESTHIQDETYDDILRMVKNNPSYVLEQLIKHQGFFADSRYNEIKTMLKDMIKIEGNISLKRQEILNSYIDYDTPCDANGMKLIDLDKIADIMAFYAKHVKDLYKVKLMKLLWYTDVLHYNKYGQAMTGLVYQHMPLGALPIAHNDLIYMPTVNVVQKELETSTSYHIQPLDDPIIPDFTLEEQETLTRVATKFRNMKSKEIVDYMHKETVYTNTTNGDIMLYSEVADVKI